MPNKRQQLTHEGLLKAIRDIAEMTHFRTNQKGMGVLASSHEILGILDEEYAEYRTEVQANSAPDRKIGELKDIAVAAIFGIASIQSGGVDW